MNCKKLTQNKFLCSGQGLIEALILIFGLLFIFAIALPQISPKAKIFKNKTPEAPVSPY
ncbi:MAG: hypothetical protein Q8N16_00830 [bacterium]|nr:hypothetical protein [bacterium]